jgi:uncharacterized protein (TIRG00374 family)
MADADRSSAASPLSSWTGWASKSSVVLLLTGGGLWTATHGVAGATWSDVATVLRALRPSQLATLTLIWLGGLGTYATVLSEARPGLGVRRGLMLNLSGSAVANLIPFGGALATGLNWRMVRTWGHSDLAFATYCVLTNALDVATKLALPMVAVTALTLGAAHVPMTLWVVAVGSGAVLLIAMASQAMALRSGRPPTPFPSPDAPRSRVSSAMRRLQQMADRSRHLLLDRWGRLVPASIAYVAAQVALLAFSLHAVGLQTPLTVVLMAAAIERLTSLVPLTPGGAGFAEVGTIAWLVANGLDPVEAVAGVLLYRFFLVAMEVPLGGVLLGAWAWFQRAPSGRRVYTGAASRAASSSSPPGAVPPDGARP